MTELFHQISVWVWLSLLSTNYGPFIVSTELISLTVSINSPPNCFIVSEFVYNIIISSDVLIYFWVSYYTITH